MTEKEKTLLAGCVKGDKAAWNAFVLQYSKLAYSTLSSTLTLHHTLAQDDLITELQPSPHVCRGGPEGELAALS